MKKRVILHAGDYFFGTARHEVATLLGSCVSVTLWHPQLKIGGMCHFALPENHFTNPRFNPRFADDCYQLFQRSAAKHNTHLEEYQAKIFGGGNMYEKMPQARNILSSVERLPVGEKNVMSAVSFVTQANIPLLVAHVGEFGYRNIIFDIETGDVWVRFTPIHRQGDQSSLSGGF